MPIFGVRFHALGQTEYYSAPDDCKPGDLVLIEVEQGAALGEIVSGPVRSLPGSGEADVPGILRMADADDRETGRRNDALAHEAMRFCRERIRERRLDMKLVDVEVFFARSKLIFYFTAPVRIDFRELVKDLASVFKTRIELRQIGVRDETKIVGGVGICGRALCCHTYLSEFIPVSIKMAKEQNLSLNPTKISGVCGRLMCCLKNEEETYEYLNSKLPGIGDYVTTDDNLRGEVHSVNVLRQLVKVVVTVDRDEKEIREYKVEQLRFKPRKKKEKVHVQDDELKKLEALEKRDRKSKMGEG